MRKRYIVLAGIVLALAACGDQPGPTTESADQWSWSLMKSPQTGRCYEVATRTVNPSSRSAVAYSGMAEVPCDNRAVSVAVKR